MTDDGIHPEFVEVGGKFHSTRSDVYMDVIDDKLVVRKHYLRGSDEVRIPLDDVKAVSYGFGCDYVIKKADGTVECIG